jgi:hypothetical protein
LFAAAHETGIASTHDTFKTIVNLLPEGDKRLGTVESALMATGVTHGEFGLVETYAAKKSEVEPWISDIRPRVRKFAKRYLRSLERAIAAETTQGET